MFVSEVWRFSLQHIDICLVTGVDLQLQPLGFWLGGSHSTTDGDCQASGYIQYTVTQQYIQATSSDSPAEHVAVIQVVSQLFGESGEYRRYIWT